jgi:hypothetical protein
MDARKINASIITKALAMGAGALAMVRALAAGGVMQSMGGNCGRIAAWQRGASGGAAILTGGGRASSIGSSGFAHAWFISSRHNT